MRLVIKYKYKDYELGFESHPQNTTATLAHRFNSRGYRTYWQEHGVFSVRPAVGNRNMTFY
jgi:hypothetical protein